MRYLSNDLIDFYEICMAMHISVPTLSATKKNENLKI